MKDKKRVLTILLVLIIVVATILCIVLFFGGSIVKKEQKYLEDMENAACKYATDENFTISICNAYNYLCKISYKKLIDAEYIDADATNPLSKVKASEDTKSYIQVSWEDGKMICKHKEG